MRDILVTVLILGTLPFILRRPWIGILVWSWVGYMNPHRLSWGFAYNAPFAMIVAITLFAAMLFSAEKYRLPWRGQLVIWFAFLAWMSLTTAVALFPDRALPLYTTIMKIQLLTLLTLVLITDARRIQALIWVIVGSIGFYSVKGGVFTLMTGGAFRVLGPDGSNIAENNALALATLMVIPLMVYLYKVYHDKRWVRVLLGASILMSTVSAVGSQSRGAFISIIVVGGFFWLKSHNKVLSGVGILILALATFNFMPESWHERMNSIATYEEDASAMGRIHAWQYSLNIANDRLTGGGFNSWSTETYDIYAPESIAKVVAHSIYFAVLADHGWPGLILFLLILFLAWRNLSKVLYLKPSADGYFDPSLLARMLQVSLVAYLSGGTFLSLSYFDLPWHIIALSILLLGLYEPKPAHQPAISRRHVPALPVRHEQ